jgi:hypothetical protein
MRILTSSVDDQAPFSLLCVSLTVKNIRMFDLFVEHQYTDTVQPHLRLAVLYSTSTPDI